MRIVGGYMELKTLIALLLAGHTMLTTPPMSYSHEQYRIAEYPQNIHTLQLDISNPNVIFQNALSYDALFGFEETSKMSVRHKAWAAINGTFFRELGQPIGQLIHKGNLQKVERSAQPIVSMSRTGQGYIGPLRVSPMIHADRQRIPIQGVNHPPEDKQWVLFTPVYGSTTRMGVRTKNYIIRNNRVEEIQEDVEGISIPPDGMVLTALQEMPSLSLQKNDLVTLTYDTDPSIVELVEAFQSGGWLVQEGQVVKEINNPWIGLTTNREPRSAVGITPEGRMVFVAVDGRQPGVSVGVTGYELGEMMRKKGCFQAVYLDGGASTTMIVKGQMVNIPSFRHKERQVGHSILIKPHELYSLYE